MDKWNIQQAVGDGLGIAFIAGGAAQIERGNWAVGAISVLVGLGISALRHYVGFASKKA